MLTSIDIVAEEHGTVVTVSMTPDQLQNLIEGLQYLQRGGMNLYLQDDMTLIDVREVGYAPRPEEGCDSI